MVQERTFGVTEARLGLTLLTCLLIALGFAILHRLGAPPASHPDVAPQSPADFVASSPDDPAAPPGTTLATESRDDFQPQVLPAQRADFQADSGGLFPASRPAPPGHVEDRYSSGPVENPPLVDTGFMPNAAGPAGDETGAVRTGLAPQGPAPR